MLSNVEFVQAKQPDNKLLLLLHRAASGNIRIEVTQAELEKLFAQGARKLAQKQGVTIEDVKLALTQPQPRILNASIVVAARKFLFRPVINLSGTVAIERGTASPLSPISNAAAMVRLRRWPAPPSLRNFVEWSSAPFLCPRCRSEKFSCTMSRSISRTTALLSRQSSANDLRARERTLRYRFS